MSIRVFTYPESHRDDVVIDPDGNISYLSVRSMPAVGKTVPELRADLEARIEDLYDHPGRARDSDGSCRTSCLRVRAGDEAGRDRRRPGDSHPRHPLDEWRLRRERSPDCAPSRRSIWRGPFSSGREDRPGRFPALVYNGDLRYNIQVHPGDLLYVADLNQSQVSVFGAVGRPGPIRYSENLTVIGALRAAVGCSSARIAARSSWCVGISIARRSMWSM